MQRLIADPRCALIILCWDLYARTSAYYKEHPEALAVAGGNACTPSKPGRENCRDLGHLVADTIVDAHLKTMIRLGIEYDVLPRESEILHLQFWATAFELLKERKAIYFETQGKNKGCWVMPASAFKNIGQQKTRATRRVRRRQQGHRSVERHGDLCRQRYRLSALEVRPSRQGFLLPALVSYPDGHEVWVTTDQPGRDRGAASSATARAFTT